MHAIPAATLERGASLGRMLFPLAALAALALATTAGAAPHPTTYRLIPLSATNSIADINAKGQVAFTEHLAAEGILPSIGTVGDCLLTG